MSWSIRIKTDKEVNENDIDNIVANLPERYHGLLGEKMGFRKESWGWHTCVDIQKPVPGDKYLDLSGSCSISGYIACEMSDYMASCLRAKDYRASVGRIRV